MIIRVKSTILVGVTGTPKNMKKSSASLAMTPESPEERSVSGDLQQDCERPAGYRQRNIDASEVQEIRTVSELLSRSVSLMTPSGIISPETGTESTSSLRCPLITILLLGRIRSIRERDFMFIDTVQDYFATYVRQMRLPYDSWREQSYQETITLRELEASASRFIAGQRLLLAALLQPATAVIGQHRPVAPPLSARARSGKERIRQAGRGPYSHAALEELGESLENAVALKSSILMIARSR